MAEADVFPSPASSRNAKRLIRNLVVLTPHIPEGQAAKGEYNSLSPNSLSLASSSCKPRLSSHFNLCHSL